MRGLVAVLSLLLVSASPPRRYTDLAKRYLDFSVLPRPAPLSGESPNPDEFRFSWQKCWGLKEGVVCEACYSHPKHYLGRSVVLCPWNGKGCRWVYETAESERFGVNWSQCEIP